MQQQNVQVSSQVVTGDSEGTVQTYSQVFKPKVFIIEDDLDSVNLIERILLSINAETEITWVASSEEAYYKLSMYKRENWKMPFDLIISDIFLEGEETGLDLYRKTNKLFPEIPFIATSGTSIAKYFESTNVNIPIFLPKPVRLSEWKSILTEFIGD